MGTKPQGISRVTSVVKTSRSALAGLVVSALPSFVTSFLIFALMVNGESALYLYISAVSCAFVAVLNMTYLALKRRLVVAGVALFLPIVSVGLGMRVYCWRLSSCSQDYYNAIVNDGDDAGRPWCFAVLQKYSGREHPYLRVNVKKRLHVGYLRNEERVRFKQASPFGVGMACYERLGNHMYAIVPCARDGETSMYKRLLHGHCGSPDCIL